MLTVEQLERSRGGKRIGGRPVLVGAAVGAVIGSAVLSVDDGGDEGRRATSVGGWQILLVPAALAGGGIGALIGLRTVEAREAVPLPASSAARAP